MEKNVTAIFKGTVQGVGFRYSASHFARQFDIRGYVKNLSDGSVELVAEGDENQLRDFLKKVCESHLANYIQEKNIDWHEATGRFETFEVTF